MRPETQARRLATAKALEVAGDHPDALVLAADTVVAYRGEVLGKPADAAEARDMLRKLRGRQHRVITGVALVAPGSKRARVAHAVSRVSMRTYTDMEIDAAIAAGVPFDKAGGYGIQDPVLRPVKACDGCICNVMGLPLWTAAELLKPTGCETDTRAIPERCLACPARSAGAATAQPRDSGILGS